MIRTAAGRRAMLVMACIATAACERYESLTALPAPSLRTHYLIDFTYRRDVESRFATSGHLVVFNPGARTAELAVTVYFEDREPSRFALRAAAGASTESDYESWPVSPGERFALAVQSDEPVIAQATLGWNNAANDVAPSAQARDGGRPREAATSYLSIPSLATRWYLADGIVIDRPSKLWFRESEDAVLLNPGDRPAHVELALFNRFFTRTHAVEVPARRVRAVRMDDVVPLRNRHYGVRIASDVAIAAQWRRTVQWYDAPDELMSFWSIPCAPLNAALESGPS